MIRIYDRDRINSYLSRPEILPAFFKVTGNPQDYPDVYFLEGVTGLFVCIKKGDEMHCHAAIPREARGKDAFRDVKNGIQWIFENTSCAKVCTRADRTKKHLLHFNGKLLNRVGSDDEYVYYEVTR